MDIKKLLDETLDSMYLIDQNDIPNIDLYMDQVTTFMESHLKSRKRNEEDKILTKTMINNYAKNDLLPSPEKKRYTKEHVLLLTLIYYYKSVLSINDIKKLLAPITEGYFQNQKGKDLSYIYDELLSFQDEVIASTKEDMQHKLDLAKNTFLDSPKKDSEYLHLYSFVSLLSFDVYLKKQLIEAIVDTLDEPMSKEEKEKALKKIREEKEKAAKKAAEKAKPADKPRPSDKA